MILSLNKTQSISYNQNVEFNKQIMNTKTETVKSYHSE